MPRVDIIIPAYNAARFLPEALESVMAQTHQDWCILLVDDGSTDATPGIAATYAEKLGARMKYIRQANGGLPAARNTAIRHGTGEFLALLDADDVWLPSRLEESLKVFAESPQVGLAYGFISRIDPAGVVLDTFATRQRHGEGWIAPYIYMRKVDLPCPTITFRRRCIEDVGFFDENLRATEDRDLWVRIALRYEVRLVAGIIAHYRVSPNAMTTDPERMFQAQLRFIEKHFGAPGCGAWARRVALSGIYRQRAEALATRNKMRAALKSAAQALVMDPLNLGTLRMTGSLVLRSLG